jgi:hypothetical protein
VGPTSRGPRGKRVFKPKNGTGSEFQPKSKIFGSIHGRGRSGMRKYWGDRITGVVCICLSLYFGWLALEFPSGGGSFPLFAIGGTILLSLIMIINSFISKKPELRERIRFDLSYSRIKPLLLCILVALHMWSIFKIGYFSSAILFLIIATLVVGIRQYRTVLLTAIILFPSMYVFFVLFLKANLPRGILF